MRKLTLLLSILLLSLVIFSQNLRWDDQFVPANSVNNTVYCIKAAQNNDIYVSGTFTTAGLNPANYVAKWNGVSWSSLGSGFDGPVYAIELRNNDVIAGGLFTTAGGVAASNLAIWDGASWSAAGTGTNGVVRTIKFYDPYIYVGGEFTLANGTVVSNIFRTNGTVWEDMTGGINGPVYSIDIRNYVFVGGIFTQAGTTTVSNVATWNATTWSALTDGLNDTVFAVKFSLNGLYAGGAFTQSGTTTCSGIAMYDAGLWKPLGSGFDNTVFAIDVEDSLIYAGGIFQNSGTTAASRIAKYSNMEWHPLGNGTNSSVRSLKLLGFDLYCGGAFTQAGLNPSNYFGRYGSMPVLLYQPQDIVVCEGEELQIGLSVWSSETVSYVWKKDGIAITAPSNDTLTINPVSLTDAGVYICEMTNIFGVAVTDTVEVFVNALPLIIINPAGATLCEGDSITFITNATSGLPVTYTWMQNGNPVAGITVPELVFNGILPADAGTYYVQVQNSCGSDVSDNFDVIVNALPVVTIGGLNSTYCYTAANDTIIYSPVGGILSGPNLNGDIFTPYGLVGDHIFTYSYTDVNGCTNTAVQNIFVFNPTPVTISGYEVFYCLSAPNDTFQAVPSGGYFSGVINDSIFSPSNAGEGTFNISYYFIDTNNCVNGDTIDIVVMQQVAFTYPNLDTVFCENEMPYTIPVFPPNGTFSGTGIINGNQFDPSIAGVGTQTIQYEFLDPWGCSGTDVIIFTIYPAPVAAITNLNPNECNNSLPFLLTGSPSGGYFAGAGVTDSTMFNPTSLQPGITAVFYYYTDAHGCIDTAVTLTEILFVEQAFFTGLQPIYCQNELNDTLYGIPLGGTFSGPGVTGNIFSPGDAGTGTHTIVYTYHNPNECVSQDEVTITVSDNPAIACGIDYEICEGDTVNITATYNPLFELFWSTGDTTDNISVQPASSILVIGTVFDGTCFNADTVDITVHSSPVLTLPDSLSECNEYTLSTGSTFSQYLWSTGGITSSIDITTTNTYSVTVTNSFGCTNADTAYVEILSGPVVELGINRVITKDETIMFIVDQGYDNYLWSDDTYGYSMVFDGDVYGVGLHTVWIFVHNDNGCYDTDTVLVTVNPGIYAEYSDYSNQINIFPNPASQFVNIEFGELPSPDEIRVCDISGKEVGLISINTADVPGTIDISRLESGLYVVHFYFGNTCVVKKMSVK